MWRNLSHGLCFELLTVYNHHLCITFLTVTGYTAVGGKYYFWRIHCCWFHKTHAYPLSSPCCVAKRPFRKIKPHIDLKKHQKKNFGNTAWLKMLLKLIITVWTWWRLFMLLLHSWCDFLLPAYLSVCLELECINLDITYVLMSLYFYYICVNFCLCSLLCS